MRGALPEANEVERSDDNPKVLVIKARPDIQNKVMDELSRLQEEFPESESGRGTLEEICRSVPSEAGR